MAQIYIAFADTPGLFASLIRLVLKQKYIHVAVSMDPGLEETYSIGRRHPSIPLIAGFEKEDKRKILRAFPEADYMVASIECTEEQKEYIRERLRETMKKRFRYHYTILGLPFLLMNIPENPGPSTRQDSRTDFVSHSRMEAGDSLKAGTPVSVPLPETGGW